MSLEYRRTPWFEDLGYGSSNLMPLNNGWTVSVENWRTAAEVSIGKIINDPANTKVCRCLANQTKNIADLALSSDNVSADAATTTTSDCLCNALYNSIDREEALSPSGWLSDSVIAADQLLILQKFPHICDLQSPVLQRTLAFKMQCRICPYWRIHCKL